MLLWVPRSSRTPAGDSNLVETQKYVPTHKPKTPAVPRVPKPPLDAPGHGPHMSCVRPTWAGLKSPVITPSKGHAGGFSVRKPQPSCHAVPAQEVRATATWRSPSHSASPAPPPPQHRAHRPPHTPQPGSQPSQADQTPDSAEQEPTAHDPQPVTTVSPPQSHK